ncbi:FUSC family protein [Streptomyces sp. CB01881]|uniref:FUSC family protein n=1 Tax=Streptomyces sp. CB01881 TaxID=2078691 RepID=UPI0011E062D2|nr:FUSC family protein [Streptomyces sp. CB01881]TYC66656.1 FUSC family protein [Streptomyces sp. CB01881]
MRRLPGRPEQPRRSRPEPAVVHRAVRVTVAACAGFYTFRYGLHQPVTATYALFAAVAVGVLARVEGGARARVRTLLLTLPFAAALVCLGTVLAVHAWTAALGMAGVGFAVAFGSVGGPRLVGLANGLQLFYILPCFPPFAPDTLPQRLAGVATGLVLLAAAERLLWPEPPPTDYRDRVARAARALARLADLAAAECAGRRPAAADGKADGKADGAVVPARALALLDDLRFSRIPMMERPAGPGAVDRALAHCATTLHYIGAELLRVRRLGSVGGPYPQAAVLVTATAHALRAAGCGVRAGGPVPSAAPIEERIAAFEVARTAPGPAGAPAPAPAPGPGRTAAARLGLGTVALNAAEGARFLVLATRTARHAPASPDDTPPDRRPGPFWYAHEPAAMLWWRRIRGNLTTRSVYFRNALRTAGALSAARLVAGALDLTHGFWVLLATLTLMRTSAVDTRTALRPALVGTACGAGVTAVLLLAVGEHPVFYAAALPPVMLFAFTAGPVLGLAWAQGMFTVVIAMVFTQLAPAGWRLAEARLVNVATGAAVGILAGLLAWPRGGGQDLRRRTAELLDRSAAALSETVAVVTGTGPARGALGRARHSALLTEAQYAQYRSERHDPAEDGPDWQAAVLTGQHTVRGAEPLLARIPPGTAAAGPDRAAALVRRADQVAAAFRGQGAALLARAPADAAERAVADARGALRAERLAATRLPAEPASLYTVDVSLWLTGLLDDLARVPGNTGPAPDGPH